MFIVINDDMDKYSIFKEYLRIRMTLTMCPDMT